MTEKCDAPLITHGPWLRCDRDKGHDRGTFPREVVDPDRKPWHPRVFLTHATPHRATIEWNEQ